MPTNKRWSFEEDKYLITLIPKELALKLRPSEKYFLDIVEKLNENFYTKRTKFAVYNHVRRIYGIAHYYSDTSDEILTLGKLYEKSLKK